MRSPLRPMLPDTQRGIWPLKPALQGQQLPQRFRFWRSAGSAGFGCCCWCCRRHFCCCCCCVLRSAAADSICCAAEPVHLMLCFGVEDDKVRNAFGRCTDVAFTGTAVAARAASHITAAMCHAAVADGTALAEHGLEVICMFANLYSRTYSPVRTAQRLAQ